MIRKEIENSHHEKEALQLLTYVQYVPFLDVFVHLGLHNAKPLAGHASMLGKKASRVV